jgi:hypothetical protein
MVDTPAAMGRHSAEWFDRFGPSLVAAALSVGIGWGLMQGTVAGIERRLTGVETSARDDRTFAAGAIAGIERKLAEVDTSVRESRPLTAGISAGIERRLTEVEVYVRDDRTLTAAMIERLARIETHIAKMAEEQGRLRDDLKEALLLSERRPVQRTRAPE